MRHRLDGSRAVFRSAVLLTLLVSAGCQSAPRGPSFQPCRVDSVLRLLVMSPFAQELAKVLESVDIEQTFVISGRTFTSGKLASHPVVVVQSGVSMVNAAMMTQAAVNHFKIAGIVYSGVAGGVNPGLGIGDVVIPARWGEYQEQVFARRDSDGWDVGPHSTKFGHFGMMFPQSVSVTHQYGEPDQEEILFWFPADPEMLDVARQMARTLSLKACTWYGLCFPQRPRVRVGGNGVSGPTYVENDEYRDWVWRTFQADALDMETAAVAHVAHVNAVPYIAFRCLSDLAGGETSLVNKIAFFQLAAENSASVVISFLKAWAKREKKPQP